MIVKNQKGISVVTLVAIAVVVITTAIAGYFAYLQYTQSLLEKQAQKQASQTEELDTVQDDEEPESLKVTEWDIQIEIRDAKKMTYEVVDEKGSLGEGNEYESYLTPKIKPEHLDNKDCEVRLKMYRSTKQPATYNVNIVGDYFYFMDGIPELCSDEFPIGADDELRNRIVTDFDIRNISVLVED